MASMFTYTKAAMERAMKVQEVILRDATSEIYYAQLVEEESTLTVLAGLKEVIERQGVFGALYSDRGTSG